MFEFLEYLINLACSMASSFFIYSILKSMLQIRNHILIKVAVFASLVLINTAVIYPNEWIGVFYLFFGFLSCLFLFYQGWWLKKMSLLLLLYPLIVSINFVTEDMGFQIWIAAPQMSVYSQTVLHTATLILRAVFWYFVRCFFHKLSDSFTRELTAPMWLIIDAINAASFISIITIVYASPQNTIITYPSCFACIITGIGGIYLVAYISRSLKSELEIQNYKYQQSYYQELEQNQQTVRKLRHDMKNHLNLIGTFLKNKETDKANTYFEQLSAELDVAQYEFCKNSIVNAVLNNKYNLALRHDIDCRFKIDVNDCLKIDDVSLCSLFSNAIDNAIEANRKIPNSANRYLSVNARYHNGLFSCEVSNPKANQVTVSEGHFFTGKKDKALHGFGIQNMRDIVKQYHGQMDVSYNESEFVVTIVV